MPVSIECKTCLRWPVVTNRPKHRQADHIIEAIAVINYGYAAWLRLAPPTESGTPWLPVPTDPPLIPPPSASKPLSDANPPPSAASSSPTSIYSIRSYELVTLPAVARRIAL